MTATLSENGTLRLPRPARAALGTHKRAVELCGSQIVVRPAQSSPATAPQFDIDAAIAQAGEAFRLSPARPHAMGFIDQRVQVIGPHLPDNCKPESTTTTET
ncbi:MAG: hypothetical protein FJ100_22180 [Deltaproteobacteria bacterium]|nr:hypothetical protein [Deltaproteobacteria bacterium]